MRLYICHISLLFILFSLSSCKSIRHTSSKNIVLAYYSSSSNINPNSHYFTHIAYAFAQIDDNLTDIKIQEVEKFEQLSDLKQSKQNIKILLSIFGERNGNFSKMISSEKLRKLFIHNCILTMQKFELDGFDIDWESPVTTDDKEYFTLLIKELRESVGKKKIITIATPPNKCEYNFSQFIEYIDFVNVMTYDMARPPFHHTPMAKSNLVKDISIPDVIKLYHTFGVPKNKILMGIPLYGRGNKDMYRDFVGYEHIKTLPTCEERWDSIAKVPYIVDEKENLVLTYDDTISVGFKCDFIKSENLGGVMYWHYAGDGKEGKLKQVIRDKFGLDH